jgi:hypothetical protein
MSLGLQETALRSALAQLLRHPLSLVQRRAEGADTRVRCGGGAHSGARLFLERQGSGVRLSGRARLRPKCVVGRWQSHATKRGRRRRHRVRAG